MTIGKLVLEMEMGQGTPNMEPIADPTTPPHPVSAEKHFFFHKHIPMPRTSYTSHLDHHAPLTLPQVSVEWLCLGKWAYTRFFCTDGGSAGFYGASGINSGQRQEIHTRRVVDDLILDDRDRQGYNWKM